MISSSQIKAARAILGIDQRQLAELADLSLPTIQRMESSGNANVRGNIDSLNKLVQALENAGVELIAEGGVSEAGGRGVRLRGGER